MGALFTVLAATFTLVGCEEGYSSAVQYTLRTDPLVIKVGPEFGPEQADPDRPNVLPLLSMKDLDNPANPMFPSRVTLRKSKDLRDPTLLPTADKNELKARLDELFGTPRSPKVADAHESLDLGSDVLARGSKLYRVHCLHCHGVTGDGRGVTARWINPHPRDFRQGLFKFESVDQTSGPMPPRREDLRRTLVTGIEGTAMPAFNLMPPRDIEDLVSYVIHLSLRGKLEFDVIANVFQVNGDQMDPVDPDVSMLEQMDGLYKVNMNLWVASQTKPIDVKPYPYPEGVESPEFKESVQRGWKLFLGDDSATGHPLAKGTNCVSCHYNYGRQAKFRWDSWGTLVRPNNLTNGVYRGGRRTIDLYYRIHSGINGSGMAHFGSLQGTEKTKTTDPAVVWDLVNFVRVLPYPQMREKLGVVIDQ